MPNIRKFLDLSTAHLSAADKNWLTDRAKDASTYEGCYGWATCAYPDPDQPGSVTLDESRPPNLNAIFQFAVSNGCDYVLFDADAGVESSLPTFGDGAAANWRPADPAPVRVLVDFSGGLFHRALATAPVEVMAIDTDDSENPRAKVPGFPAEIWANVQDATVEPCTVNAAFDGIEWLSEDAKEAEG